MSLKHRDSAGNHGVIVPGVAQRMSAGTGIRHSEQNPNPKADVQFVQMWVPPATTRITPAYQQVDVADELAGGGLVPIAGGAHHGAAIMIHQPDALLWAGRLKPDGRVAAPDDRHVHMFVARGSGTLEPGGALAAGDAARLMEPDGVTFTAGSGGAEVLIWATA